MLGTYIGAMSRSFSLVAQMAVFAVVMAIASVFMIRPLPEADSRLNTERLVMIEGLIVGALTGFVAWAAAL